jgi:hypothetical protein
VDNFVIAPTPDSGYTVNLSYFYRPASLTDSTISFTVSSSSSFTVGETITGGTSGASTTLSSFTSDTTESWLSTNAELALLYGSLIECYIYMKGDPDIMNVYNTRFAEAIGRLKNLGEAKEVVDEYTMGPIRKART